MHILFDSQEVSGKPILFIVSQMSRVTEAII